MLLDSKSVLQSLQVQTGRLELALTALSQPQDTSRLSGGAGPRASTRAPGEVAGANDTPSAPTGCASSICSKECQVIRQNGGHSCSAVLTSKRENTD